MGGRFEFLRREFAQDETGFIFSASPEVMVGLLAVAALITAACFLPHWDETTRILGGGEPVLANGCPPGYEPVGDGIHCSSATWYSLGRLAFIFFVINAVLLGFQFARSAAARR